MNNFEEKLRAMEEISWVPSAAQAAWAETQGHRKARELVAKIRLPKWKIAPISRVFDFQIHSDLQAGMSLDEAVARIDDIISSFE